MRALLHKKTIKAPCHCCKGEFETVTLHGIPTRTTRCFYCRMNCDARLPCKS